MLNVSFDSNNQGLEKIRTISPSPLFRMFCSPLLLWNFVSDKPRYVWGQLLQRFRVFMSSKLFYSAVLKHEANQLENASIYFLLILIK